MTYTVSSGTLNLSIPYNTIPPTTQKKPRIREDRQNFMFHRPAQPQSALKSTHTEAVHHQEVLLGSSILVFVHEGSWSHLGQTVINPLLSADISSPPTSREDRSNHVGMHLTVMLLLLPFSALTLLAGRQGRASDL